MKTLVLTLLTCGLMTQAHTAERFATIPLQQMSPEQSAVAQQILKTRHNLSGPFMPWLYSPVLADRLQSVGEYVRYNSSLPKDLSEFAILITAREWTSQLEWYLHYPEAIAAGVTPQVLQQLARRQRPHAMSTDQALVYDLSIDLHRHHGRVPDALFDAAQKRLGERGVIDLIGLNGYYDVAAMTINAAQVPLPPGVAPPLQPFARD